MEKANEKDKKRQLEWLNTVKSALGSSEVTSLRQAEVINSVGIYIVGKLDPDVQKEKLTLDDVLILHVPTDDLGFKSPKRYQYKELHELQSKLMVVAGKAELVKDDVERFTIVFGAIVRLCNVYIKLLSAGCVLFTNWQAKFLCDPGRKFCAFINFEYGDGCTQLKGRRSEEGEEDLSTIIPRLAKFMETCLEGWLKYIGRNRNDYHHLNFFTIDEMVILQKQLVLVGGETDPSDLIYPLLSIVKHDCTKKDLIGAFRKAKSDISKKEIAENGNDENGGEESIAKAETIAKFINAILNAGFSEQLAREALEEGLNPEEIEQGMLWCIMHDDQGEMEVEVRKEQVEVKVDEFEGWTHTGVSMLSKIQSMLSEILYSKEDAYEDTLIPHLEELWQKFLCSIESSMSDYLSVEHLGIILKRLAETDEVLSSDQTICGHDPNQPFLQSDLCAPYTTLDEKNRKEAAETSSDFLMLQKNRTESAETSSDFLPSDRGAEPITKNAYEDLLRLLVNKEKTKDLVTCRSCRREFDSDGHRPLLLPCLDGICKMCTNNIKDAGKTSYECGKCLTKHICIEENMVTLQIDPTRELLAEIYRLTQEGCNMVCEMCPNQQPALHRCVDCSHFICIDCVNLHSTLRPFKSHVVVEMKDLLKGRMEDLKVFSSDTTKRCPVTGHGKEIASLFCFNTSCSKPICMRCAITIHKDHDFRDMSSVGKENETKVQNQIKDLLSKADQAAVSITRLTDLQENYLQMSRELQDEIKAYFREAKQAVEMREKTLLNDLSTQLNNEQSSFENEKKRLMTFINSCKEACYYGKISSDINDVPSFMDVAGPIQSQFKNLGDQLNENQTILKRMKFLKEPPITSYLATVNSLGRLSVSKAISSKSTAVITPSICEVQNEVKFEIQLLSSQGKPIVDEDVSVFLELNGKIFTVLPCVLDKPSTSFIGSWIPKEPIQLAWVVVSDGIRMETLEGIIDVKNQAHQTSN